MISDGIDYDKTVNTKKLVFHGQTFQKFNAYLFLTIMVGIGSISCYMIFTTQTRNNPTSVDYIMAVALPILIILVVYNVCKLVLNRDKLTEIKTNLNIDSSKMKLVEAARNLNWKPNTINDKYIVITTYHGVLRNIETVTLIFFPDNKIYFNSINWPNDYMRPSRYDDNYNDLVKEYSRIEKE